MSPFSKPDFLASSTGSSVSTSEPVLPAPAAFKESE